MFRFFSMRIPSGLRMFALLAFGLVVAGTRAEAQSFSFGLFATGSPNPVIVSNSLTYTIIVTNLSGFTPADTLVTNTLAGSFQILSVTNSQGTNSISGNVVVFDLGVFNTGTIAQMAVTVQPMAQGTVADAVTVVSFTPAATPSSTNVITQVTNAPVLPQADLAVAMTEPTSQVFSNDWMVYGVSVTNLGPATAPGVFLTNTLPTNVAYKSVSPSNKTFTVSIQSSNVIFNLGALTNGAFRNFQLTVQPTNAGTWTFVSVVSTNGVYDPNPTNNSASINVAVSNFLSHPGQLTATIVSPQKFNQLSGRLEQSIVLSNAGPTSVDSARVTVTGLTNWLSNATGTNNGNPFVTYASALANGQGGAYLLLQFYPNQNSFPFTNSQLRADGVTMPNLAPAASGLMPTNILLMARLPSGGVFLEFPTLTNRAFTVEYSSNLVNWLAAQPITVTPANYTAWIDYGPPETVSHPTNTPMRFYRVFLNP